MEKQRFGDGSPPENAAMPLAGTKVLEFSGLGPTPFGAMLLADLGASVLRIERAGAVNPLGGDPRFDFIYRGRPSMAVDLKSPEGLERVRDLAGAADVLIEGYRPGTMERLGLGHRVELIKGDNDRWQQLRAEMRSTQKLYDRVRKLGLGLTMPQPEQVLRLSDLPLDAEELKQSEPGEYRTVKNTPRRGRP